MGGRFFIWLWIGAAVETDKAIKAKNRYNELVALISKDDQDREDLVKTLELVRALVGHFHSLLPKMKTALDAMQELSSLFSEQDVNFGHILDDLGNLETGVGAMKWASRREWINSAINEAVETFKEVSFLFPYVDEVNTNFAIDQSARNGIQARCNS